MRAVSRIALLAAALLPLAPGPAAAEDGTAARGPSVHALAVTGDLKYGPGFTHFDYTDPEAVRGGEVRLARVGTFDSLNPFILKGVAAAGWNLIYSRLCEKAQDEPLSEYGHLAESMWLAPDRSSVTFFLRPGARWHDGEPVTAHDIVFSFYTLVRHGTPFYRSFYADVDTAFAEDEGTVTFELAATDNRELPVVLGQLRALPRHYWEARDFTKTTLEPPLGSGPYRIESVDPGRSITYARVDGNWDEGLPARRGQHNFDRITYDYYRDDTVAQEALKAGEYDLRAVSSAREWSTGYDHPAVREGRLLKAELPNRRIRGMSGFVFNSRRARFADRRVRRALAHAFDFEWTNATLFHGLYTRTESHFANSELAATGTPRGRELEILESYRGRVPDDVFGEVYRAPSTDGDGSIRANLRKARRMLREAGWVVREGVLVHEETGEPMAFEFLLVRPSYERVVGPVRVHLKRLGIATTSRTVDASQYYRRLQEYDYDVVVRAWNQYLSPGNEQRNYWSSEAAGDAGQPQLRRGPRPGGGRAGGGPHRRPDPPRAGGRRPRPGPGADLGPLRDPPLAHHGPPPGLLEPLRAAGDRAHDLPRLPGDLVDRPGPGRGPGGEAVTAYILRRLLLMAPTLLGIMVLNFIIVQAAPGGPVEQVIARMQGHDLGAAGRVTGGAGEVAEADIAGTETTARYRGARGLDPELIAELEALYGFDKPAHERFVEMMGRYLRFDFGTSFYRDRSVVDLVLDKLPVSISLGLWTTLLIYAVSIPLGVAKAVRRGSRFDVWTSGAIVVGNAVPTFLFAILLVVLFAGGQYWQWFPLRGLVSANWEELSAAGKLVDYLWHLCLPVLSLVIGGFAGLTLLTRNSFLDEIGKQYVVTARAKGLGEGRVLYGHVFRNAMLIVIAGFPAAFVGILFTGALLTEIIFSLDGLGLLGFEAAVNRDYPVVFGTLYVFTLLGLVLQLVGDLTYTLVDRRIDFEARS